jgi:hypothetical protein
MGGNKRFNFPKQEVVTSTRFSEEIGPLIGFALQCGFQELVNLLPTFWSHESVTVLIHYTARPWP